MIMPCSGMPCSVLEVRTSPPSDQKNMQHSETLSNLPKVEQAVSAGQVLNLVHWTPKWCPLYYTTCHYIKQELKIYLK